MPAAAGPPLQLPAPTGAAGRPGSSWRRRGRGAGRLTSSQPQALRARAQGRPPPPPRLPFLAPLRHSPLPYPPRSSAAAYESGLALSVYRLPGVAALPANFSLLPPDALVVRRLHPSPSCPRVSTCFGQAHAEDVAAQVGRGSAPAFIQHPACPVPCLHQGALRRPSADPASHPPIDSPTHSPLPPRWLEQWSGELWVPADGVYSLLLTSRADSRLWLDGRVAIDGALAACVLAVRGSHGHPPRRRPPLQRPTPLAPTLVAQSTPATTAGGTAASARSAASSSGWPARSGTASAWTTSTRRAAAAAWC